MGKVHGSLARAGKVKSQTPKVEPQEKKKRPKGRAAKREKFTRRFVNVTLTGGKRKVRQYHKLLRIQHGLLTQETDEPQPRSLSYQKLMDGNQEGRCLLLYTRISPRWIYDDDSGSGGYLLRVRMGIHRLEEGQSSLKGVSVHLKKWLAAELRSMLS
ncbi:40S ribosomal protein S30 [Ciborinia camelliae]|nr:40S ribosomal protein S30 [Ciborinia camelliae]